MARSNNDPPVVSHEVGEKVYAKWGNKYYSAVITASRAPRGRAKEERYDVRFDDSKTKTGLTKNSIISRSAGAEGRVEGAPYQVGDRVEALFEGKGERYYPARVVAVVPKGDNNFGFHILYNDNDVDRDLAAEFVRRPQPASKPAAGKKKQPASKAAPKKQPASKAAPKKRRGAYSSNLRSKNAIRGHENRRKREAAEREAALEEEVENNSENDREDADDGKPAGKRRKVADAPGGAEEETDDAPEDTLEGDRREREELNALKRNALALEEANKKLEGTVEGLREKVASLERAAVEQDRERDGASAPGNDAPEGERGDDEAKSADSADAASKPAAKKKKKKKRVTFAVDPNEEGKGPEIGVWSIEALRAFEQELRGKGLEDEQVEAEMAKLCRARSQLIADQNGTIMLPFATERAKMHKRNVDSKVDAIRSAAAVARGIVTLGEKALLGNEGVPGFAEFRALLNVPGGIGEKRAQVGELERKIETLEGRMRDDFEDIIEKGKKEFAVYQDTPETVEERIDLLMEDMFEA